MSDYTWELTGATLTIYVQPAYFSMDLLPSWLDEISCEIMLPDWERVRTIEIEESANADPLE